MAEHNNEEFYVGYLPQAPRGIGTRVRLTCLVLALVAALTAVALVAGQHRFPASFFEFGQVRQFEGIIFAEPYPVLLARRPGQAGTLPCFSRYTLVAEGKHGAEKDVAGFDGRLVRLKGTLIYRDGVTMIEVVSGSVEAAGMQSDAALPAPGESPGTYTLRHYRENSTFVYLPAPAKTLGTYTLTGEIVDSKCYLGVMNPGSTKVHRECAVRCISGGSPPMFVVKDAAGQTATLLLVSADGREVNQEVLDLVAEPIEITGQVVKDGDQLTLRADPKTYRRVR
ncbi:MAG TPA: hypothetical protein VFD58_09580 [Blastocatellia bacterium]|nr:hypothetical protein [Blastocatellia bacterium]